MDKVAIGKKIAKLRKEKNMSATIFAGLAGISASYVKKLENGEKCPTVETLDRICYALGISIVNFLSENEYTDKVESLNGMQKRLLNDFLNSL